MALNPDLVHYVCIAKGSTVLAEFNHHDPALSAIAAKCLENTPPHHANFTHTVRSKTYSYLMDDPFVYFAIFDANLAKSEGLALLKTIKNRLGKILTGERKLENLTPNCLQEEVNPVFRRLLGPAPDRTDQSDSVRLEAGQGEIRERLKGNGDMWMKNGLDGEVKNEKKEGIGNGELRGIERSKKVWKKQVWIVLSVDLIICVMLFGFWLWVCRGLKCIET